GQRRRPGRALSLDNAGEGVEIGDVLLGSRPKLSQFLFAQKFQRCFAPIKLRGLMESEIASLRQQRFCRPG
ncbi:MAG TPA: hypothetical protein VJ810_33690, partial [Blastocatellia bacterium]|nr:hypothetical protein [Blastocatellia bacterium]